MGSLQGDHHCPVAFLPVPGIGPGRDYGTGQFVTEGDFGQNRFVPGMVEPGVQVGSADSAVGDFQKNLILSGYGNRNLHQGGGPFAAGMAAKGFHHEEGA